MQIVLQQIFPLGRFHATPWKVFPYEDPHGEWPPSPWRFVRAVLARSYQLDREIADASETHAALREIMVRAFAASEVVVAASAFDMARARPAPIPTGGVQACPCKCKGTGNDGLQHHQGSG